MDDQFEKFISNIKLSKKEREDVKKKYDGVCKKLHEKYYPDTEYNGATRLLIGSYGKKTHVSPARDVDVIFKMPYEKFDTYSDNSSNCQSQLLQDIKAILAEKYPNTPIKAWGKVVKLEFSDPQHNVELQPAWENDDGTFTIPNSENNGSWENANPRAEINRIRESNNKTGKTRSIIRMVKKWTERISINTSSYEIENNVVDFFLTHSSSSYSETVKEFFEYYSATASTENLRSACITAKNRAEKACEFEKDGKLDLASEEWRKVFGEQFPRVEAEKTFGLDIERLTNQYPSADEEFIDRGRFGYSINLNPVYSVKIDTYADKINGFRPGWLSDLLKMVPNLLLMKNADVTFKIVDINIPEPYDVYWKVRNFGEEAKKAGKLRGEITKGREKKDGTAYFGTHLIEC